MPDFWALMHLMPGRQSIFCRGWSILVSWHRLSPQYRESYPFGATGTPLSNPLGPLLGPLRELLTVQISAFNYAIVKGDMGISRTIIKILSKVEELKKFFME